jgi:hypothetical protein
LASLAHDLDEAPTREEAVAADAEEARAVSRMPVASTTSTG